MFLDKVRLAPEYTPPFINAVSPVDAEFCVRTVHIHMYSENIQHTNIVNAIAKNAFNIASGVVMWVGVPDSISAGDNCAIC